MNYTVAKVVTQILYSFVLLIAFMLALHYNHKVKEYSEMGIPTPDEMMVDIARCEATLPRNQICKIQTITIIRDKDVVESSTDDTPPLQQDIPNDPSNL